MRSSPGAPHSTERCKVTTFILFPQLFTPFSSKKDTPRVIFQTEPTPFRAGLLDRTTERTYSCTVNMHRSSVWFWRAGRHGGRPPTLKPNVALSRSI